MVKTSTKSSEKKSLSFYEVLFSDFGEKDPINENKSKGQFGLSDYAAMKTKVSHASVALKKHYPWETSKVKIFDTKTRGKNHLVLKKITIYEGRIVDANNKDLDAAWEFLEDMLLRKNCTNQLYDLFIEAMRLKNLNIKAFTTGEDNDGKFLSSVTFGFTLTKWNNSWEKSHEEEEIVEDKIEESTDGHFDLVDEEARKCTGKAMLGYLADAVDQLEDEEEESKSKVKKQTTVAEDLDDLKKSVSHLEKAIDSKLTSVKPVTKTESKPKPGRSNLKDDNPATKYIATEGDDKVSIGSMVNNS